MINSRLKMKHYIRKSEWKAIQTEITSKKVAKDTVDYTKNYLETRFSNIEDILNRVVGNKTSLSLIMTDFTSHKAIILGLADTLRQQQQQETALLMDLHTSREDLQQILIEKHACSVQLYTSYITLHSTIAENTTPLEWRILIQEVREVF